MEVQRFEIGEREMQSVSAPPSSGPLPASTHAISFQPPLLQRLQNNIRQLETASRIAEDKRVSSGCNALDQILPSGGYARGTIVEWIAESSGHTKRNFGSGASGADYLSLLTANSDCADGGALVVIDPQREFYPPAAAAMGINLGNLIVLRPNVALSKKKQQSELFWAIDQSLRCQAVAAVWGPIDSIDERWFRRFQLSAESSGVMGLFIRPPVAIKQPSWSEVAWVVRPTESDSPSTRRVKMQLHRCRGARTGQAIEVEINTITGKIAQATGRLSEHERAKRKRAYQASPLSLASQLAHPTSHRRAERA